VNNAKYSFYLRPSAKIYTQHQINNGYQTISVKYDKQDQQGRAAFNEHNPHTTQQQGYKYFLQNYYV
jgi:hypothetical protein